MADVTQSVSALRATSSGPLQQIWKEVSTGYYARLTGGLLVAISSNGSTELVLLKATTSGALFAEMQGSTEEIGHVILSASTARIGSLYPSTETIGGLYASTAKIGSLQASTDAIGSLYPTTAAIGQVGGHTVQVSASLAPTTSQQYAAGDLIGGQISMASVFRSTSVMSGVLQSIVLADKSTNQAAIDWLVFGTATTGTTYTNDAALDVDDGDLTKLCGVVSMTAGDYAGFADNAVATIRNVGLPIAATTGMGLTLAAVNRSTGPQYASTGDLTVLFSILQD